MCIYRYNMSADVGSNSKVSDSCAHGTRLRFESSTRQDISRSCEWTIWSGQTWASPPLSLCFLQKNHGYFHPFVTLLASHQEVRRCIWPSRNIQIDLCQDMFSLFGPVLDCKALVTCLRFWGALCSRVPPTKSQGKIKLEGSHHFFTPEKDVLSTKNWLRRIGWRVFSSQTRSLKSCPTVSSPPCGQIFWRSREL